MKTKVVEFAKQQGFDIRFARAAEMRGASPFSETDPKILCGDVQTIILLFARYAPAVTEAEGGMAASEYYRISNASYHAAKDVAAFMTQHGVKAVFSPGLNARGAALLTGGTLGRNGFYYHDTWGSFVCIHTILTDEAWYEEYGPFQSCSGCLACAAGCPAGAITEAGVDYAKCVRKHMHGTVPEELREYVYQLFGCEKCQLACPLNSAEAAEPVHFPIEGLIKGEYTKDLIALVGPNMAREKRVLSQTLLYVGAKKLAAFLPWAEKYAQSDHEAVREHAKWAVKRIKGEL